MAKLLNSISNKFSSWQVFTDFIELSALAISNSVDKLHFDKREKRYLDIVGKYSKDDAMVFPQILAELTRVMQRSAEEKDFPDYLGTLFHEMEFHNKQKGQFFTPKNMADMCAEMTVGGKNFEETIAEKGYIAMHEPASGSGVMVLALAGALAKKGYDWSRQMYVLAQDLDVRCTHMCYIQLSLYGIPAVVVNGNTLNMEEYERWYTPVFMVDGWYWREASALKPGLNPDIMAFRCAEEPLYGALLGLKQLKPQGLIEIQENEQIKEPVEKEPEKRQKEPPKELVEEPAEVIKEQFEQLEQLTLF